MYMFVRSYLERKITITILVFAIDSLHLSFKEEPMINLRNFVSDIKTIILHMLR